jgi:hypothetical protein
MQNGPKNQATPTILLHRPVTGRLKVAWEKESAEGQAADQPQNEFEETNSEPQINHHEYPTADVLFR